MSLTLVQRAIEPWFAGWRLRILMAGTVLVFALAGLVQVWPYLSLPRIYKWPAGDDYDVYHYCAVNVVQHGLAMPAAGVPYTFPAGFLYIYFVALCYRIFGIYPPAVFIVQSAMLGGAVALLFLAFRRGLGWAAQALMLALLAMFAFLDIERHYAMQLFSENLLVFEVAAFFYLFRLGFLDGRRWARIAALAMLGTIPLTRPNAMLFVPAALAWLLVVRPGRGFWRDFAVGAAALAVVFSAMAARNLVAGGQWVFFTPFEFRAFDMPGYGLGMPGAEAVVGQIEGRQGALPLVKLMLHAWSRDPAGVARAYARRMLFIAGFLPVIRPEFQYRPHWMLLWLALLPALVWRLVRGPRPGLMVQLLLIWMVMLLGPVIAVSAISNYGFRFVVPAVLPAVAGAVVLVALRRPTPIAGVNER